MGARENYSHHGSGLCGRECLLRGGFRKISRDPHTGFWCRMQNKLFQIKAHPLVHTTLSGKEVLLEKPCCQDRRGAPNILEKWSLQAICWFWAALPGAQHLERCFAFTQVYYMTRRAFLALRVIQRQGKFRSKGLVKNWCKWVRKMKISQNLWVQLTAEQFSYLDQVKTYPGMHSLCLAMRFRKSCTEG